MRHTVMADTIMALFIVTVAAACDKESPASRMSQDAIALGFEEIECREEMVPYFYAPIDTLGVSKAMSCAMLESAIRGLKDSHRVPSRVLNGDSVVTAVGIPFLRGRAVAYDTAYEVYFELKHRSHYLSVLSPGIDRPVEVTWAPEGLRYGDGSAR